VNNYLFPFQGHPPSIDPAMASEAGTSLRRGQQVSGQCGEPRSCRRGIGLFMGRALGELMEVGAGQERDTLRKLLARCVTASQRG
jgi:hypothetical protein